MDNSDDYVLIERGILPRRRRTKPHIQAVERLRAEREMPAEILDVLRQIDGRLDRVQGSDADVARRLDALQAEVKALRSDLAGEESWFPSALLPIGVLVLVVLVVIGPSIPIPFSSGASEQPQLVVPTSAPAPPTVVPSPVVVPTPHTGKIVRAAAHRHHSRSHK